MADKSSNNPASNDMTSTSISKPRVRMAALSQRILIYTTCYNVLDGVTLTIRKIEQEIIANGHHVCILTTKSGDMNNTHIVPENPNRTVLFLNNALPLPIISDPNDSNASYQIGFALSKKTKEDIMNFEPSLVHITCPDCTCLHLIQFAREKEIPLMGTYHSNIPEYMDHYPGASWFKHILRAFFRHQYNFLQALYVPTPFIHKHLVEHYHMDKGTNLQVWGRGIDLEKFSPKHRSLKFRQKLGIGNDEVVILWVGRLVAEKRPDIFARVIRRLHAQGVSFRALVIGAGPNDDQVKGLPKTHFLGWMSGDELSVAYASSDVFLFPSAVETFGNVTLEAAASGLPLIVESGCSGHLVDNGVNGYACTGDDEDAWFEGTLNLVVNHKMRKSFSIASRNLSLNWEQRTVMQRMLENYSRVTDDFYTEFGGRHENRDIAFTHEGSFPGGTYPRPLGLIIIEFVIVILLQLVFYMEAFYVCCRKRMSRSRSTNSIGSSMVQVDSKNDALASLGKHSQVDDSEVEDEEAEMQELLPSDASTVASTNSVNSTSPVPKTPASFAPREHFWCAHVAAKTFVAAVYCQWRIESRCRKSATFCFSPSRWTSVVPKRKDSSVADKAALAGQAEMPLEDVSLHGNRGDEELGRRVRSSLVDA